MTATRSRSPRVAPAVELEVPADLPVWALMPCWAWPSDAVVVSSRGGEVLAAWDGSAEAFAE